MIDSLLAAHIRDAANKIPVVATTDPRQSGKFTLIQAYFPNYTYRNLEDIEQRQFARSEPKRFLQNRGSYTVIDEVQYTPDLLSYIFPDQMPDTLTIAIAQLAPVWLRKKATLAKIEDAVREAAAQRAQLVCFGETLLPGYPFWLELTDAARFNATRQKELFAHYLAEAVTIDAGDLTTLCTLASEFGIAIYIGCAERATDRAGHSIYCSLVYIDPAGMIRSVHRKLMPTYEERLAWSIGDGHGLRVHELGPFTVGGLNCWENWMPLARTALYAQGENLHVATWPGNRRNTIDLTRHIALENRMYVLSVSGLMRKTDITTDIPHHDLIRQNAPDVLSDGGSCLASPDGSWVIEPIVDREAVVSATIDLNEVRKERQNFDPSGHYARPDVFSLTVNTQRQQLVRFIG